MPDVHLLLRLLLAAKVSFLNKLIHLANVGNGSALEASSSKVVAGLEPLKTNILLSTFGRIAQDKKIDRNDLIQHCLSGKGIDEFHSRNKDLLADAINTHGDIASPTRNTSSRENVLEESAIDQHSIIEQIKACNEDMEQTRAMISRIVTKPKCSDKLLSKPPFRFIHDLITEIGKTTQFNLCQIFR